MMNIGDAFASSMEEITELGLSMYKNDWATKANLQHEFENGKTVLITKLDTSGEKNIINEDGVYLGILVHTERT